VPLFNPGDSRHQRREGSTELFAAASFRRSRFGAPLRPTPLQRRGCGLPVDLLGPCGAFTKPCRPLTFPLSPAGTPESKSFSPDVLSYHWLANLAAYRGRRGVDLLVRGPGSAASVSRYDGPKPENAFRRVRDLRAFTHKRHIAKIFWTLSTRPYRFAFYPSAPVRQAMLRISSRLAPSFATTRPCDRPVKKTRDALNRLLPLKRKRAPAPRAFPIHSATFAAWTSHGD